MSIIQRNRSIIPECDVSLDKCVEIVEATKDIEGIGGYKLPAISGREGWENWVNAARTLTDKPLIYEKAGTDMPDTGRDFMENIKGAGFDAVILFPLSGPITEYEWIKAAQDVGLGVIIGGEMTQHRFLDDDFSNEKNKNYTKIFRKLGITADLPGFISMFAPNEIYTLAAKMGVTDFVVPGNKPKKINHYKKLLISCGVNEPVFYSSWFVAQGGNISDGARAAGKRFHGIIGRGVYSAGDIREAALELTSRL